MTSPNRIIVSVTNDLITDQRVHRTCTTLHNEGYDVTLVGRNLNTGSITKRPYRTRRFKLPINKGPLFYLLYNVRLLVFLLWNKADIYLANDLDTLPANYFAYKIKGGKLLYDSHEYFCHVPELINRPLVQKTWLTIEKLIFPHLKNVITVNEKIAQLYSNEFKVKVQVIRNLPITPTTNQGENIVTKKDLGIPEGNLILYQGAVNKDRGLEEAVLAMKYVQDAILLIIGDGDIVKPLNQLILKENLSNQVILKGKIPFEDLPNYTSIADLGISLEKDSNLNYKYSLPNKLFDYIHASVPVLSSALPVSKSLFEEFNIGNLIHDHTPTFIAETMNSMLCDQDQIRDWKENAKRAARKYSWENEESKLLAIIKDLQ